MRDWHKIRQGGFKANMKALRFHQANDLRLDEIEPPASPGPQEVRLRVLKCGICGSDLHEYTDGPILIPTKPHPFTGSSGPQILGHEFSAVVDAIGAEVRSVKVGDRVAVIPHLNKPGEYYARRNLGHISSETGLVGFSWYWGGLAEYALVPEQNVVYLSQEVSDEQGAIVEPASVALNAVDLGGVTAGSSVLVTGAGPIGALAAMAATASGATRVFVFEPNEGRCKRLATIPGIQAFSELDKLKVSLATKTEAGLGVDVALECAGHEAALDLCIDAVKRTGSIVQVGLFVKKPAVDMFKVCEKALRLVGSWGFPITIGPRVVELIASGRMPVELIVSGQVNLDEVVQAGFDQLIKPNHDKVKILVKISG